LIKQLAARLDEHIAKESASLSLENQPLGLDTGKEPDGDEGKGAPPGEEKPEEKKPEDKPADKSISPPIAATSPEGDQSKEACPCKKAEELARVKKLQEKAKDAAAQGVRTPGPDFGENDKGTGPKDALAELLASEEKLFALKDVMSVERFINKYTKGEI
jgi:hypothetical protein